MVLEWYLECFADHGELGRVDPPHLAGEVDGADEGEVRHGEPCMNAAGIEHASVAGGVVGGEEVGAVEKGGQVGPDLGEGRLTGDILPSNAVDIGEVEVGAGRLDEARLPCDDLKVLDAHEGDGACAGSLEAGGLEVDGDEGG